MGGIALTAQTDGVDGKKLGLMSSELLQSRRGEGGEESQKNSLEEGTARRAERSFSELDSIDSSDR